MGEKWKLGNQGTLYRIIAGGYTPHHGEGKNKYLVERYKNNLHITR